MDRRMASAAFVSASRGRSVGMARHTAYTAQRHRWHCWRVSVLSERNVKAEPVAGLVLAFPAK